MIHEYSGVLYLVLRAIFLLFAGEARRYEAQWYETIRVLHEVLQMLQLVNFFSVDI